jgi:hypothetical protein
MIGATMPENLLLVSAEYEGKPIASSLVVYQRDAKTGGTLYGRYWGALEHVPCLHFETRTISRSNFVSKKSSRYSKAAHKASTRWHAGSCLRGDALRRTGSRIRHSADAVGAFSRQRKEQHPRLRR